jgi:hypothetical protein
VTIDGTQTLTNKTLTSPNVNEAVALTSTATKLNYLTSAAGTTGTASTNIVFSTSPVLTTPNIGAATASGLSLTSANTTQTTTSSAVAINANSLTSGTGLYAASSSLSSGALVDLAITGTAGLTNQKGINVSLSGANATGAQTTYGTYLSNTHTGTSNNVGLYATASGGSNNYAAIFDAGNVGIGTTAPGSLLQIAGANAFNVPTGEITLTRYWVNDSTVAGSSLFHFYNNTDNYEYLAFGVAGAGGSSNKPNQLSQIKMVVGTTGSVGIGTTAPGTGGTLQSGARVLDIVGAAGQNAFLRVLGGAGGTKGGLIIGNNDGSGTNYGQFTFDNNANTFTINQLYSSGYLGLGANSRTNDLVILSTNGNVGIGTTDPGSYKLNVNGTAYVSGAMTVGGYLTKSGGGFTIDHPLDPANKVLTHSFVESPDMKDLYDGVVVLDANGESTIELPDWFEALNRDFRYQLTPIGRAGMLYVKEEIKDNKFTIGGEPGTKVSWQVTGTRKDAWAEKYRPKIEEEKGSRAGLVKKGEYIAKDCYEKKD